MKIDSFSVAFCEQVRAVVMHTFTAVDAVTDLVLYQQVPGHAPLELTTPAFSITLQKDQISKVVGSRRVASSSQSVVFDLEGVTKEDLLVNFATSGVEIPTGQLPDSVLVHVKVSTVIPIF